MVEKSVALRLFLLDQVCCHYTIFALRVGLTHRDLLGVRRRREQRRGVTPAQVVGSPHRQLGGGGLALPALRQRLDRMERGAGGSTASGRG